MMEEYFSQLGRCGLLDGIPREAYLQVLSFLQAVRRDYRKDSVILNMGDQHPLSGVVLRGTLEISLLDEPGGQINVNHVPEGRSFGMAMACAGGCCPIRLRAVTDCTLLFFRYSALLEPQGELSLYEARVSANLLRQLADQTVFLNRRLRILGQKRLRDKIRLYLQDRKQGPDGTISVPFTRSEWAEFLAADRSALSRELGKLAEEGILQYDRHGVKILKQAFLKNE